MDHVYDLLIESIKTARSLNAQLIPKVLYESGLTPALEWLAKSFQETYQLNIDTDCLPDILIEREDLKVLLFESVRELLFNAVKHAESLSVRMRVAQCETGNLCITVSDDGIGFDCSELAKKLGRDDRFGLFSIRERLELVGGHLEFTGSPGKGSVFRLIAPIGEKSDLRALP